MTSLNVAHTYRLVSANTETRNSHIYHRKSRVSQTAHQINYKFRRTLSLILRMGRNKFKVLPPPKKIKSMRDAKQKCYILASSIIRSLQRLRYGIKSRRFKYERQTGRLNKMRNSCKILEEKI